MQKRIAYGALLGFAVAVSSALAQSPDSTKHSRAFLGVAVEPSRSGEHAGAVVRDVTPDSPAAKAEIKPGDVIVKIGDRDVKDPEGLIAAVSQHKPGEHLTFHVMRQGQAHDLTVTLGERPAVRPGEVESAREGAGGYLGVLSRPVTPEDRTRLGQTADRGAVVTEVMPGSPAARAGLRRDDVIVDVDGKPVTDPADLRRLIEQFGAGKDVALTVMRGQEKREVRARLEESPVDGIATDLGRPFTSRFLDAGKVGDLERRVADLERRVRELEQKHGPEK